MFNPLRTASSLVGNSTSTSIIRIVNRDVVFAIDVIDVEIECVLLRTFTAKKKLR